MPLNWEMQDIPLIAGLDTGASPRALTPPALLRADNVAFSKAGGADLRHPYRTLPATLSDIRSISTYGDELLVFTKDRLYSWSPGLNEWQDRGAHLALEVTERPVFTREIEQHTPDRAELDGVTVFVWDEGGVAYIAALDSETGAVLAGPGVLPNDGDRTARVVAVGSYFHVYALNSSLELFVDFFLPTEVAGFVAGTAGSNASVSAAAIGNSLYDVAVGDDNTVYVVWQHTTVANYKLNTVSEGGTAGTETTKTPTNDSDGVIAIAVDTANDLVCAMRVSGTDVRANVMDTAFSDISADAGVDIGNISSTDNQLTCAWRGEAESDGTSRCYGFWSGGETTGGTSPGNTSFNYVEDDGSTAGTAAVLQYYVGLGSKAFAHDGRVYVWLAFAGESQSSGMGDPLGFRAALQNAYYLRDDGGEIHARAVADRGGGFSSTTGFLPHVTRSPDGRYRWAGIERLVIPLEDPEDVETISQVRRGLNRPGPAIGRRRKSSKAKGYAKRSPIEITLAFDSRAGRRTAQIGRTLYLTGGLISQFDGANITELGWLTSPWFQSSTAVGSGNLDAGDYAYKWTYAHTNNKNEIDRSSSAVVATLPITSGQKATFSGLVFCQATRRKNDLQEALNEGWRTAVDPTTAAPFYKVTSSDPSDTSGDNHYLLNDADDSLYTTSWVDDMVDSTARTKEPNPENQGVLENLPAPAASIIWANDERVFLAGIADDPREIWYSKIREAGEVVSFNDILTVTVPDNITALVEQSDTLVALCESSIYVLPGIGFDNTGSGQNYGPAQVRSIDVGAVSAEAIALTSIGTIFKSRKGWHLLDLGFNVSYIGQQVEAYDDEEVVATHVIQDRHEIRFVTSERILVFNTKARAWSSWTETGGVGATIYKGVYHFATNEFVRAERDDYVGVDYGFDIEWAPINFGGLARFGRVKRFQVRADWASSHDLRVRVAYNDEAEYTDDRTHPVRDGAPYRLDPGPGHSFSRPRCQSARIRLTTQAQGSETPPNGEAMRLDGLSVRIGRKQGVGRFGPGRK